MNDNVVYRWPYQFRPYRRALVRSAIATLLLASLLGLFLGCCIPQQAASVGLIVLTWFSARAVRKVKHRSFPHAGDGIAIGRAIALAIVSGAVTFA